MSYWSKLSMKDKADVMRLFLDKGISDLDTIRREYNIFAEGGDTNDADLVDWIIREEGFNKTPEDIGDGKITLGSGLTNPKWHALYKKRGNKWSEADNRMAVAEEVANRRKWAEKNIPNWDTLPDSAQKALLSYKYNYNFTSVNSPKLFQALADSNLYEAAKQMDATSKDPKFKKGLMDRRKREQEWFLSDIAGNATPTQATPVQTPTTIGITMPSITEPAVSTTVRNNYVPPTTTPYNRGNNMRRAFESAVAFNRMMDATSIPNNPLPEYPFPISYAAGGKIHIDPSKKGTFTAAASKHGMGVQEFASRVLANKEDYSPAMVKKANFARNASKWHGFGGNLYDGTSEDSQQMTRPNIFQRPDGSYFYSANDTEIDVTPMNTLGDNPAQWTYTDSSGKIYRPAQPLSTNYTLTESENTNPLVSAANNYFRELDWRAKNDPASIALQGKYTMPLVLSPILGKGAAVALTNPYVDAALTSGFGAHGLQKLANGEADWSTALEITPLGRLARPMWNAGKEAVYNIADRYMFMPHQNSFTRGIGGEAGLQDLVESGLVRGNPIGTEVTAEAYGKLTRSNRNNFNDIMRDTGIDDIAHRYYNRTLTEEDFNAIKKAAQKYKKNTPSSGTEGRITLLRRDKDPLSKYSSYQDYQAQLTSDRQTLANATSLDDFGQPLAYFYDNGRNPLTAGHDYAASDYGVRINNASGYNPRIFDGHLHYSMPEAVPLRDPNVEVFEKGPFGLTVKLDKETMKPVWQQDLKTLFSKGTNKAPQTTAENGSSIIRTVQDNGKIRLSLPSHSETNPRQFVLEPQGDDKFYVHMRTWDGDHVPANLTNEEKQQLFDALYNELPEGAEILFPKSGPGYYGTRGTVAGLQRLSRDPRFTPGTKGTLQYLDKDGKTIKTYEGTSFIKIPKK